MCALRVLYCSSTTIISTTFTCSLPSHSSLCFNGLLFPFIFISLYTFSSYFFSSSPSSSSPTSILNPYHLSRFASLIFIFVLRYPFAHFFTDFVLLDFSGKPLLYFSLTVLFLFLLVRFYIWVSSVMICLVFWYSLKLSQVFDFCCFRAGFFICFLRLDVFI